LTRLDENRAKAQLAQKAKRPVASVKNATIWGNHSATQVPDFQNTLIDGKSAAQVIGDEAWLQGDFFKTVQQRGTSIIAARGASSAASAANALIDHVRDLYRPTPRGEWHSVCVVSDGSYGVTEGLISSFPVRSDGQGGYEIVQGLQLNPFLKDKVAASVKELEQERALVADLLK
jgi:malate dehydrogenase